MIMELLDAAIDEVIASRYEITEFQLGSEPMGIFINELKQMTSYCQVVISEVKKYKSIPVREHSSKDAVMYAIKPINQQP